MAIPTRAQAVFLPVEGGVARSNRGTSDNADQAGALGYHDLTTAGLPIGKVFAKTTLDAGDLVSVTLSHEVLEVLEMLGDPDINLLGQKGPRAYAYEVCDAVEDDSLGYDINGVRVSDFVYPQYFETFWHKGATKFDYLGHLSGPVPNLTHGGYMSYLDFGTGQWKQTTAARRRRRRPPQRQRRAGEGAVQGAPGNWGATLPSGPAAGDMARVDRRDRSLARKRNTRS